MSQNDSKKKASEEKWNENWKKAVGSKELESYIKTIIPDNTVVIVQCENHHELDLEHINKICKERKILFLAASMDMKFTIIERKE